MNRVLLAGAICLQACAPDTTTDDILMQAVGLTAAAVSDLSCDRDAIDTEGCLGPVPDGQVGVFKRRRPWFWEQVAGEGEWLHTAHQWRTEHPERASAWRDSILGAVRARPEGRDCGARGDTLETWLFWQFPTYDLEFWASGRPGPGGEWVLSLDAYRPEDPRTGWGPACPGG